VKTVIISGVGPTYHLHEGLKEHFNVAIYDQASAQKVAGTSGEGVICPIMGAENLMYESARNDAALYVSRVVDGTRNTAFSINGTSPEALSNLDRWLPGLTAGFFSEAALNIRVLNAYAAQDDVDIAAIITHEDVTPKYRTLAQWAKARGITTIQVPHNSCFSQTQPDVHDKSSCDWILATSRYMRDWYTERGYPKHRIRVTGFPPWDHWHDLPLDKEHARRVLFLDDRPVVTFCTGWAQRTSLIDDHSMTDVAANLFMHVAKKQNWQVIWKLHPGDQPNVERNYMATMLAHRVDGIVTRDHLSYTLKAADVVVSVGPSNVLVEAALCNRPPVLFDLRGYGFDNEPPWVLGLDVGDVTDRVESLLDGQTWEKQRAKFTRKYAYRNDGKATKRTVKEIRKILGG
jgi:hypothetical protein